MNDEPNPATATRPEALLIDVDAVALMLDVAARTVWRLADSGKMPRPLAIGRCRRWNRKAIQEWIDGGCQPVRPATRHVRG